MKAVSGFVCTTLWVTALISCTGAILGAGIFPLAGLLTGSSRSPEALALSGGKTLGFYFFLWAPGSGLVIAAMREWRRRHPTVESATPTHLGRVRTSIRPAERH